MRTKHFFMAMALPLAFAACTSEEFESAQNATDLSGRKVLGDVVLTFGDEANTRMTAAGGAIGFVAGDGVGACLVDNYKGERDGERGAIDNYDLTSTIQTNYQYKYENGAWMTTARMVEGNYIFYAPYNGDHLSRTPLKTGVPTTQELKLGADGKVDAYSILDAFVKSGTPAYVGYKFLEAEGQDLKVSVNMKPIFAYPLVTFSNDDTSAAAADVVITKFVVTGAIPTEMELNIGDAEATAKAGTGVVGNLFDQAAEAKDNGAWVKNAYMIGNKTIDVTKAASKESGAITINVPNGALKVAKGGTVKFHIVLPATAAANYKVYAYDNSGKAYSLDVTGAALSAGKIYPDGQYKSDGTTYATAANAFASKTSQLTLENAPLLVGTTEELVAMIAGATANLTNIETTSDDVKITPEVVAAINPNLSYTFKNKMAVVGDLTISNFGFTGGVVIKSGTTTWESTVNADKIEVAKDATLKVLSANAGAEVTTLKGGKLEIGDGENATAINKVTNKGETTWNKAATVTNGVANYSNTENDKYVGTVNLYSPAALPTSISGVWNVYAAVELEAGTEVTANGKMNIKEGGSVTTGNTYVLTINGKVVNEGMLIQSAASKVSLGATGVLDAKGRFKGVGIAVSAGRVNLYSSYIAENAFTVTDGKLYDVVENWDATAANAPVARVTDAANALSVKNLTIGADFEHYRTVELQDGGVLTLKGNVKVGAATEINTAGNATISGVNSLSSGETGFTLDINVAAGKLLTLDGITLAKGNASCTLTGLQSSDGTYKSEYKLKNYGVIKAEVTKTHITEKTN